MTLPAAAAPALGAPAQPSARDARLAMYARRALLQDERLASLNLGISVRQGVATVWGPVPSQELARRAVDQIRQVQGLLEVRSQLYIDAGSEPSPVRNSVQPPLMPLEPRPPSALMGRAGDSPAALGEAWKDSRRPLAIYNRSPVGEGKLSRPLAESVSLLPPVHHATPVSASPGGDGSEARFQLLMAVEQVRQSDARYRLARPQVQGKVVHLYGMVARQQDMADLARALSRLPGIEQVILQNIQIESRLELPR